MSYGDHTGPYFFGNDEPYFDLRHKAKPGAAEEKRMPDRYRHNPPSGFSCLPCEDGWLSLPNGGRMRNNTGMSDGTRYGYDR